MNYFFKFLIFITYFILQANETWYRVKQAEELVDSYLKKSTADAVILGGDFNAPPILKPGILHYILTYILVVFSWNSN